MAAAHARKLWLADDPAVPGDPSGRRGVADAIVAGRVLAAATEPEIRAVLGRPVNRVRKRGKLVLGYQVGIFQRNAHLACSRVLEFTGNDRRFRPKLIDFCAPGTALPSPGQTP
jgi:hypothetical protein